jgi:hypothetical protein
MAGDSSPGGSEVYAYYGRVDVMKKISAELHFI